VQYPAYRVVSASVSASAQNCWTFLIATAVLLPVFLSSRHKRRRTSRVQILRSGYRFVFLAADGLIPPAVVVASGRAHDCIGYVDSLARYSD
jgi:hypothetical protein